MNPYTLALGLALAGKAKAEEPKECIDKLVINVEVEVDDLLGQNNLRAPETQQRVSGRIKEEFEKEVGLPTEIYWGNYTGNAVTVVYTTRDAIIKDVFPTYESLASFIYRQLSDEEKTKLEGSERVIAALPLEEQETIKRDLLKSWNRKNENIDGITDVEARISYIVEPLASRDPAMMFRLGKNDYLTLLTRNTIHEIGHVLLGRGHAERETLPDGEINVMYPWITRNFLDRILMGNYYSFSDDDKTTILKQVCKPEEQQ